MTDKESMQKFFEENKTLIEEESKKLKEDIDFLLNRLMTSTQHFMLLEGKTPEEALQYAYITVAHAYAGKMELTTEELEKVVTEMVKRVKEHAKQVGIFSDDEDEDNKPKIEIVHK